jgi:3-oxoacyl-[acyl-carrier-protein] synthase II
MMNQRKVVVTGIGFCSPVGNTLKELKESLLTGRSGIQKMPEWEKIGNLHTKVAGVCHNVDEKSIPRNYRRSMGRVSILAAIAAKEALEDSGISSDVVASPLCGVSFGSTAGSSHALEIFLREMFGNQSLKGLQPSLYLQFMSHTCAANLAIMFQIKGPTIASCTACVAGSQGIGFGYEAIKHGRATIMLSGGAEEMHFMDAGVFDIMRATSTRYNDRPEYTPRPFDIDRDGLVVGEGSGCLVLEEYEHAKVRDAKIYAEIVGFGTNCDGNHLTNPSAEGMAGAILRALEDAGLSKDKIAYVNAHATGTVAGDVAESKATYQVLGADVPVSGIKGYMGHTLGACGAIESIATILMLKERFLAPTKNLETPDPEMAPINHIIGNPRDFNFSIGMTNNFAFGGINTSLIFAKV